jgi:hypothetical protein
VLKIPNTTCPDPLDIMPYIQYNGGKNIKYQGKAYCKERGVNEK